MSKPPKEEAVQLRFQIPEQTWASRPAIDDSCRAFPIPDAGKIPDGPHDGEDVLRTSRLLRSDSPDWLIRKHNVGVSKYSLQDGLDLHRALVDCDRHSTTRSLANAYQRQHTIPSYGSCPARGIGIRLAEEAAPLGVADLDDAAPHLGEHGGRDTARHGPGIKVESLLSAGEDLGIAELGYDRGQGNVVGENENVDVVCD